MDRPPAMTFDELSRRVDEFVERTLTNRPGKVERWSLVATFASAGIGSLVAELVGGRTGLRIMEGALLVECLAALLFLVLFGRREWGDLANAHRSFARDLDHDYVAYHEYVTWLRNFSDEEIARRLRYVRDRKQMMSYRLGIFTGGIERLGVFPLLVVLYLQFKDWTFGDWAALAHVHLVGGLLLLALSLAYVLGWFLVRLRIRLDAYEALLAERLQPI